MERRKSSSYKLSLSSNDRYTSPKSSNIDNKDEALLSDKGVSHSFGSIEKNLDHRLVTMRSSNVGYVSKIDNIHGSLFISKFAKVVLESVSNKKQTGKYLYEIADEIKRDLHQKGLQYPEYIFNEEEMRNVKFRVNERY